MTDNKNHNNDAFPNVVYANSQVFDIHTRRSSITYKIQTVRVQGLGSIYLSQLGFRV